MILIMSNGKTNQVGRIEYGTAIRHRNPLLCTISHTAFYLFYRWNIAREPPPQFQQRQQWYHIHLLKGHDAEQPLSYDTQLEWTSKVFEAVKLSTLKKANAGRAQGAKQAELCGVNEGQIRRAGRWNSDSLTSCYLTNIPRKFVRGMAGFEPQAQGNYYLPRAKVEPSPELQQAVWPWVDKWMTWFQSYESADDDPSDVDSDLQEDRNDLAAQGFLRLLVQLRTVLLQDSVVLRAEFPEHPLWSDPIFVRQDYLEFAEQVRVSLLDVEEPEEIQIRKTMPAIAQRLNIVRQSLTQTVNEWGERTQQHYTKIGRQLDDIVSGRVAFLVRAHQPDSPALPNVDEGGNVNVTAFAAAATAADTVPPFQLRTEAPASAAQVEIPARPPSYKLSRTIQTVPDLWREWTAGLGGGPAVQSLEDLYGAAWRPLQSERVMFGRRKVIIDEIRARQRDGLSTAAAVEKVELVRQRGGNLSLYGLYKLLHKSNRNPRTELNTR